MVAQHALPHTYHNDFRQPQTVEKKPDIKSSTFTATAAHSTIKLANP